MDCKEVKERLIDYIDGESNNDEEIIINEHLEICYECKKEWEELKSTMDYIINNSNKIDTSKEMILNTSVIKRKSIKRITRTGLIAIALSFIFVVTAFATDVFGFIEYWRKISEKKISAWEQLIDNGVGQKLDISVVDKNIRITAEGVIADELNTVILLKIEDLVGNERYTPHWDSNGVFKPIKLDGDISEPDFVKYSEFPPVLNYAPLYTGDDNTTKLMVGTLPINKDSGTLDIEISKLTNSFGKGNDFREEIIIDGEWKLSIPAEIIESRTHLINKNIDLDGNKLTINKVIMAPTATKIDFSLETHNKEKQYFINDITFLLKVGKKTFGRSQLSRTLGFVFSEYGVSESAYPLESLYLEDPKEVELIVNTYSAKTKGFSRYVIDYENLPQTLDFKGNTITIEDIITSSNQTNIIIKDDESKDREYTESTISLSFDVVKDTIRDGKQHTDKVRHIIFAKPTEIEIRDSNDKKIDLKDRIFTDNEDENYYPYVIKQELSISKDDLKRMEVDEEKWDEYLRPRLIQIDGLDYKKFPKLKTNIKLK